MRYAILAILALILAPIVIHLLPILSLMAVTAVIAYAVARYHAMRRQAVPERPVFVCEANPGQDDTEVPTEPTDAHSEAQSDVETDDETDATDVRTKLLRDRMSGAHSIWDE